MSKKILASILAAASILSLSVVASAEGDSASVATTETISGAAPATGVEYGVDAIVSYGTVDVTLPAKTIMAKNSVVVNPYNAAISTEIDSEKINNTNFIASPVYTISNNDKDNGLKVIATVSVKKATGLVIVDGNAKAPEGWATAVDKNGDSVRVDAKDDEGNALNNFGTEFNPLVSYDKISLTYTDKTKTEIEKAVGGAVSTKQAMNTCISLVGGETAADVVKGTGSKVDFAAKGTTGGTLLELSKAPSTGSKDGYFTVVGDLNPAIDREMYTWGKEALQLSIVLKVVPVAPTTP